MNIFIILSLLIVLGLRNVGPVAWVLTRYDAGLRWVGGQIYGLYKRFFVKHP